MAFLFLIFFISPLLLKGCGVATQKRVLVPPEEAGSLDKSSPFLKAHMLNGQVYIFSEWSVDSVEKIVSGKGELLDVNREMLAEGDFSLPLDSVAIFETNIVKTSPSVIGMAIITSASVALTVYCITNPKACFGSCPTFYVEDEQKLILQAEGFSSSIAPSLEASDIDALYRAKPIDRKFQVIMKNEALETHVIRYVDLLAVRRPKEGRVFVTSDGVFWQTNQLIPPTDCQAPERSCLNELRAFDGLEHTSQTDSTFLGTRETIDLEFDNLPNGNLGLVVASRQSLLSTYLFYQTVAYMGTKAGDWFASLERGDESLRKRISGVGQVLGGIEVFVGNKSNDWIYAGELRETGPLATDTRILPLSGISPGSHKIRLRLTKGHWRIDYVALAVLEKKVTSQRLQPMEVHHSKTIDSDARKLLIDSSKVLITLPGDIYTLTYSLPEDFAEYELFLKTQGYYMEWIRDEWLSEENPTRAAMMFLNPERALYELAPEFKKVEVEMEELFWRSRYAR